MAQPDDDPALGPLIAYLEQHREQVNIVALRKQLIAAVHPQALVDEAVRRIEAPRGVPRTPAWPAGLGIMVLNLALIYPAFFLVTVISGESVSWAWLPLAGLGLLYVAELVVGLRLRQGPREFLGRALVWGAGFTASVLALLALLFGICVAIVVGLYSTGV